MRNVTTPAAAETPGSPAIDSEAVIAATVAWVEKAVIGLNLCPFARGVHTGRRIRYVVCGAESTEALVELLVQELELLAAADPAEVETTLLIHPRVLGDFLDYNDFLDVADAAVEQLGLAGEVQVASFHPRYQFAGTERDAIDNFTNRSPYPTLHLLRESSIERAVAAYGDTDRIFENNIETLRRLGRAGWNRLGLAAPEEDEQISRPSPS
jgi:hypothetical protein